MAVSAGCGKVSFGLFWYGGLGRLSLGRLSLGQAVKFRQGPSGSVMLRRVGARRLSLGKVR